MYNIQYQVKYIKERLADRLMELRQSPYLVILKYISKRDGFHIIVYDPVSTKLRDNHREVFKYNIQSTTDIDYINTNFDVIIEQIILKDNIERFMKDDF